MWSQTINISRYIFPNMRLLLLLHNNALKFSCWSCGKNIENLVSNLFCSHCNVLQRPDNKSNYFKLMGIQETYDIEDTYLAKKYKELQRYLHPDKFANKNKKELEISEEYSSLINEAYHTLLHPLARGVYMLRQRGHDISENTEVDKEFLMKIMQKNEEVEEADTEEEIMKLNEESKIVIKKLQKQLSQAFSEGDINLIIRLLSYMKYFTSIDNQIQSAISRKGIIR